MDKPLRPHLACDVDFGTLTFPMILLPKVDGVRGTHLIGQFTGRSLKPFKNPFVGKRFDAFPGVDGELALGDYGQPRLCSLTTGFVNRKTAREGKPTESDGLSASRIASSNINIGAFTLTDVERPVNDV